MISDGILPSNEGRGYVLRRLLRRAVRHGRILGVKKAFMSDLAKVVIKLNGSHYTELVEKQDMIGNVLKIEEDKFNQTIDQGLDILNGILQNAKNKILSGSDAFKLYDTYGFPLDLTKEIVTEKGYSIDEDKFNELMNEQKKSARLARKESNYMGADVTIYNSLPADMSSEFIGYDNLNLKGNILAIVSSDKIVDKISENDEAVIITDKTPFYPLMGGQVGDSGRISIGDSVFEVINTIKIQNIKIGHIGKVISGEFKKGDIVDMQVDERIRHLTAINHTSTHLLQAALRTVLGKHVEQAGSLVEPDKLRFDFTHFKALTADEILKVEKIVNQKINEAINVTKKEMTLNDAKQKGAMALFGEKYGEIVRTIQVGDFSFELCGGTHIDNTAEIKCFKIVSETGVAAGIRRIEALTSDNLINYYNDELNKLDEIEKILKSNSTDVLNKIDNLLKENKSLKNEIDSLKKQLSVNEVSNTKSYIANGLNIVIDKVENKDNTELKVIADSIKEKLDNYVVIILSKNNDNVSIVVSLSDLAVKKGLHAGKILKEIATIMSGNGGGRDKFAEGKGKDTSKIDDAIECAKKLVNG